MEYEGDGDTNCGWCICDKPQRIYVKEWQTRKLEGK